MNTNSKQREFWINGHYAYEWKPNACETIHVIEQHDMQVGEILHLIYGYMKVHTPGAFEEYEDGTSPEFYYGEKR